MPLLEKEQLVEFLRKNVDVFAWDAYEAPGVDPNFICHHPILIPLSLREDSHLGVHSRSMQRLSKMR